MTHKRILSYAGLHSNSRQTAHNHKPAIHSHDSYTVTQSTNRAMIKTTVSGQALGGSSNGFIQHLIRGDNHPITGQFLSIWRYAKSWPFAERNAPN